MIANQTDATSLARLSGTGIRLLQTQDYDELVRLFGYALALGRPSARALHDDFLRCLVEQNATALMTSQDSPAPSVKYVDHNGETGLVATVEQLLSTDGGQILIEFVLTKSESGFYLTLEQVS